MHPAFAIAAFAIAAAPHPRLTEMLTAAQTPGADMNALHTRVVRFGPRGLASLQCATVALGHALEAVKNPAIDVSICARDAVRAAYWAEEEAEMQRANRRPSARETREIVARAQADLERIARRPLDVAHAVHT